MFSCAKGTLCTPAGDRPGRKLNFVYFGGGTPSYLSTRQLESLVSRLSAVSPWQDAEEITFECEPGTLSETKLSAIREMGVTSQPRSREFRRSHSGSERPGASFA